MCLACGRDAWSDRLVTFTPLVGGDPLVPSAALLPLSDTRGGDVPLSGTPGPLRPLVAALRIAPVECGKHDITASRWYEDDPTQKCDDGRVVPDTVKVLRTDT